MSGGEAAEGVFCTSEYDVAQIARAMHAGADDFLMSRSTGVRAGQVRGVGVC